MICKRMELDLFYRVGLSTYIFFVLDTACPSHYIIQYNHGGHNIKVELTTTTTTSHEILLYHKYNNKNQFFLNFFLQ